MKSTFLAVALLVGGAAVAQNPYIAFEGAAKGEEGIVVAMPRTALAVDLRVVCETVACGPYARYAQKYLGVRAPLTDKSTWRVDGASIALLGAEALEATAAPAAPEQRTMPHAASEGAFAALQADKVSSQVQSLEEAARIAAERIFSLRRHRLELITGEAGENVFGEGLEAALEEIARQEQSLLELFLGKQLLRTETRRFAVYPEEGKQQYVFTRFSPAAGVLPASDLSGEMVVLQITPSENAVRYRIEAERRGPNDVQCRVANLAACAVLAGGQEVAASVLPVFEFGRSISVALPR